METFLGIMIPFLGTALGAACVFFMKRSLGDLVQRALAGFAAGVMGIMEATGLRTIAYESALAYTRGITVDDLRAGYSKTSTIPLGRSGKLSEVADLCVYLASQRASYVHGVTVNVAGGKTRG